MSRMVNAGTWTDYLHQHRARAVEEFLDLLKIPSISTDPAYAAEVHRAADWVSNRMRRAGIENVAIHPTGEHACVTGDWLHAPGKPTILVYGHFDVQPADPLELWTSPPFEPVISDGCVFARGASDMKGNVLLTILSAEALLATKGALSVNLKFIFEGQEESMSRDLGPFVAAQRDLLACDHVISADGAQWNMTQGAVWMGVKGACAMQVDLETSNMDLHSGLYGGAVPNALHAMAELIATLHTPEGGIAIKGFFDPVLPLEDEERGRMAAIPFTEAAYLNETGAHGLLGESGYSALERSGTRPTVEVNGMWGGYQGAGLKTVIPAKASAKISCRLVPNQEPAAVLDVLEAHIMSHVPIGAQVKVTRFPIAARPYRVPMEDPCARLVGEVLAEHFGKEPYFVRVGGSLPITDMFLRELGAYTHTFGFSQPDERMHSPNEFYRLSNFDLGQRMFCQLYERLAELAKA
jgi:acetylornithine deacetylase/succinyl-diaminopimelate desuccinylase-like protein